MSRTEDSASNEEELSKKLDRIIHGLLSACYEELKNNITQTLKQSVISGLRQQ